MSFSSMLDHTCQVWRATTTLGAIREEVRSWAPVGAVARCTVRRPSARMGDIGGGMAPIGERAIYLEADVNLQPRDVIQLLTGPDSPGTFEVDAPVTRPRGHHIEATCRHWAGQLS